MERQPDCRGVGHQHRDGRAGATATGRGRLRRGLDAQVQSQFRPATDFRRRGGSQADRSGLRAGPGRPRQMDLASPGGESGRTADRRERQRQHDRVDYAHALKDLSDRHFPEADKIVLVQDNLNTHTTAALYEAFTAAEARRLVERFEWHYTPKHGSWLDMAESELAVLSTQCLDRRIPNKPELIAEVAAWEQHRNKHHAKADWQFTTADARVKLARLYPQFA